MKRTCWILLVALLLLGGVGAAVDAQWIQDPPVGIISCSSNCTITTSSFTTAGSTTWTQSHNGSTFVWADVIAAGGGSGGCADADYSGGGAGGAGEVKYHVPLGYIPYNTTLTVYVGTKGAAGDSPTAYVGVNGEDSYLSLSSVDVVRAHGGKGGQAGLEPSDNSTAVAFGGEGGKSDLMRNADVVGCHIFGEDAKAGSSIDGVMFSGAGGGCGGYDPFSYGGMACWPTTGTGVVCTSASQGQGGGGGGGGATMFGVGGNGGGWGAAGNGTKSNGTVGSGGGGAGRCQANYPKTGKPGGDGKIIIYSLY